jgi:hypothetical protein
MLEKSTRTRDIPSRETDCQETVCRDDESSEKAI